MENTKRLSPYTRFARECAQELGHVKAIVLLGQTNGTSPNGRNVPIFVIYEGSIRDRTYLRDRMYGIANRGEFEYGVPFTRLSIMLATQADMVTEMLRGKRLVQLASGRVLYDEIGIYAALRQLQSQIQNGKTSGK